MSRRASFAWALGGVLIVGLAVWPVQVVKVSLPKQGNRLIAAIRVDPEDFVSLTYRHSVELTEVEGRFKVGPGSELLAVETRMESVGSGLPNAFPGRTVVRNGWLVVDEGRRPVGSIRFFVVPINRIRLSIADRPVDLSGLDTGTLIQVAAERTHLMYWLLWSVAGIKFTK